MKKSIEMHMAALVVALAASAPCEAALIVDQANPAPPVGTILVSNDVYTARPAGQSFTPMFTGLDFVTVYLSNFAASGSAPYVVTIYQGTGASGASLGSSKTATEGAASTAFVEFDFASRVALTPGSIYTFIVSPVTVPTRTDSQLALVEVGDTYAPGSLILSGAATPGNPNDAAFSEGIFAPSATSVPEPASVGLVGLGLAALAATRRRRKPD